MARLRTIAISVVVLLAVLATGLWIGGHPQALPSFLRGPFVDEDTAVVAEAIDKVHDDYYRKIPRDDLADASIKGIVASLGDRFSNYFTPKQYRDFQATQSSEFTGVGISIQAEPQDAKTVTGLRVVEVYDESPAQSAGLRRGDLITAADGKAFKGLTQDDASSLIKGPKGTTVRLTLTRDGQPRTVKVDRATVTVPMVAHRLIQRGGKRIGYLSLTQFGSGAHAEVYAALRDLLKQRADRFVFDLRRNGGGLVSEAQLIASAFLSDGPVVTTRGRSVPSRTLNATGDPVVPRAPLVVLVDRDTASASEIVTGALQDRDRATVVGTRTFGKGVFQEVLELSNGGALDITAGQYFTPKGRNLGGRGVRTGLGIQPDVRAQDDLKTGPDEGLQRALSVVASK